MREKILIIVLCVIGITAISFGMIKHHNVIFIVGIILIICGYLIIRKRLKESIPGQEGGLADENNKKNQ